MCCKVFMFENKKTGLHIYLNANDRAKPQLVLDLFVNWFNKDYAPMENVPSVKFEDFRFLDSFCPIDFFDESSEIVGNKYVLRRKYR